MWYLMMKLWVFLLLALVVGFVTGWFATSQRMS